MVLGATRTKILQGVRETTPGVGAGENSGAGEAQSPLNDSFNWNSELNSASQ